MVAYDRSGSLGPSGAGDGAAWPMMVRRQGQVPSISTSREKLRNVLMS
jgi:hypothetical protein